MSQRYDPAELDVLKSRTSLSKVFETYGIRSKGSARARWAVCCFHHEKSGSLKIDDQRGRYKCFGCGVSGDHFTFLNEFVGKSFHEAVEYLGGSVGFVTTEERRAIEQRNAEWEAQELAEKQRTMTSVQRIFDNGKTIHGTHAEAYLAARGLRVVKHWTFDIRFVAALTYRGWPNPDADDTVELGTFPTMIAAIRNPGGDIIGLHRTYLDPDRPAKLTPPGDQRRNKAKKVLGEQRGGMIRLSPLGPRLAMGEGIETSQAWFSGGFGGIDDVAVAAAVSLGNLAGSAMGSAEHPSDHSKRVPNGIPDMERPGVVLPDEVRELVLIGDGDSDPAMTRARLMVAGRRYRNLGRRVFVSMAPQGKDFADLNLELGAGQ
ncbi:hypothetical protein GGQ99_004771 [Aminobacter niigataensis]|uniref:Zinc finger CHC2-type domain-containing protein n=1 Tax=Aminobacter niigataensis TaxID=83265 RepID=A0ABR6L859_9HYPH|nr:CHC2 zinc finger domain-containing protein [Aminobacter niigataensis]MBB4652987.1 hypothetical protein [Aminobacter niigataensis]